MAWTAVTSSLSMIFPSSFLEAAHRLRLREANIWCARRTTQPFQGRRPALQPLPPSARIPSLLEFFSRKLLHSPLPRPRTHRNVSLRRQRKHRPERFRERLGRRGVVARRLAVQWHDDVEQRPARRVRDHDRPSGLPTNQSMVNLPSRPTSLNTERGRMKGEGGDEEGRKGRGRKARRADRWRNDRK